MRTLQIDACCLIFERTMMESLAARSRRDSDLQIGCDHAKRASEERGTRRDVTRNACRRTILDCACSGCRDASASRLVESGYDILAAAKGPCPNAPQWAAAAIILGAKRSRAVVTAFGISNPMSCA